MLYNKPNPKFSSLPPLLISEKRLSLVLKLLLKISTDFIFDTVTKQHSKPCFSFQYPIPCARGPSSIDHVICIARLLPTLLHFHAHPNRTKSARRLHRSSLSLSEYDPQDCLSDSLRRVRSGCNRNSMVQYAQSTSTHRLST